MADTSRTLRVIFDGSVGKLAAAGAKARAVMAGVDADNERSAAAAEAASARVEKASAALQKARVAEADAAGKVRVAEAQLEQLRASGKARADQLVAAEERLAAAKRKHVAAEQATTAAAERHAKAEASLADELARAAAAADDAAASWERLHGVGSKLEGVAGRMTSSFVKLGATASAVQGVAGATGGLVGAVTTLAPAALALPGIALGAAAAYGTWKLATAGVSDALSGNADALAELTPNARSAVQAVQAFAPAWSEIQNSAQDEFFRGLNVEIEKTGKQLLPLIAPKLEGIATGFNGIARSALVAARSPFFTDDVRTILEDTSTGLSNMESSAGNALQAFVGLGAVGSKLLPGLGASIDDVAERWNQWVQEGVEDGSIEQMLDDAIDGFQSLGRTVSNFSATGRNALGAFADGLGGSSGSALGRLEEFSQRLEDLTADSTVQAAFRSLGETVGSVGDAFQRVLDAGVRELAPIVVELGPVVSEVAGEMADWAVGLIQTVGPALQATAGFLREHKELVGDLAPALLTAVAAYKAFTVLQQVKTWADAAGVALLDMGRKTEDLGKKAQDADGKTRGLGKGLGLLAIPAALVTGGAVLEAIGGGAEEAGPKVDILRDQVDDLAGAMQQLGTFDVAGIFTEIGDEVLSAAQKWESGASAAGRAWGEFTREMSGFKLEPIEIRANASFVEAYAAADEFMTVINNSGADVNINGNTTGAGFALRTVLQEIAAGKSEIIIDGNPIPAQAALDYVIGVISNHAGMVDINGNPTPAGEALRDLLVAASGMEAVVPVGANVAPFEAHVRDGVGAALAGVDATMPVDGDTALLLDKTAGAQATVAGLTATLPVDGDTTPVAGKIAGVIGNIGVATMPIDGDINPVTGKISQSVALANGLTGTITVDGNPDPATGKITGVISYAGAQVGTVTIDANQQPADGKIQATIRYADGSTGTVTVDANQQPATGKVNSFVSTTNSRTATVGVNANTGPAQTAFNRFMASNANKTITVGVNVSVNGSVPGRALGAYTMPGRPAFMAAGGLRRMSAARAEIVPPRQPRIIGDRMRGDEAFIPVDDSPRSHKILALTAARMGYRLMADGGVLTTGGSGDAEQSPTAAALRELVSLLRADREGDVVLQLDGDVVARIARREIAATNRASVRRAETGVGATY